MEIGRRAGAVTCAVISAPSRAAKFAEIRSGHRTVQLASSLSRPGGFFGGASARSRSASARDFLGVAGQTPASRGRAAFVANSPRVVARERVRDGRFVAPLPLARSRRACLCVRFRARRGGGNSTPARRAFDKPMAMACSGDRAPCSPSRMCSISSRTNSPACVDGDLPSLSSSRARSIVSCSGSMNLSPRADGLDVTKSRAMLWE